MKLGIAWLSIGNSHFNSETIDDIVRHLNGNFDKARIVVPKEPARHTYQAVGYDSSKAQSKANSKGNNLRNHAQRSINGLDDAGDIEVFELGEDIESHPTYARVRQLYETNPDFRRDIRAVTQEVIGGMRKKMLGQSRSLNPHFDIEQGVNEGVNYLLKEIAFVESSPARFGAQEMTYVYHKPWKIFQDYVEGKYDGKKKNNLRVEVRQGKP